MRIAKGGSLFCYPEPIDAEMRKLFDRLALGRFLRGPRFLEFCVAQIRNVHTRRAYMAKQTRRLLRSMPCEVSQSTRLSPATPPQAHFRTFCWAPRC